MCCIQPAQGEGNPSLGGDICLHTRYVWRGLVFDEDPVLQADLWMQAHGVTLIFWGNCDLTDLDGDFRGQFNEWDTFIEVALGSRGSFIFGSGLYYLNFPSSSGFEGSSTAEIAAWVSGDIVGSPRIIAYWDVWQWHGLYANLNLSHAVNFYDGKLSMSAALGWGDERHNLQCGVPDTEGFLDFQSGIEYIWLAFPKISITPGIHYSTILQNDIRDYYSSIDVAPSSIHFSINVSLVY